MAFVIGSTSEGQMHRSKVATIEIASKSLCFYVCKQTGAPGTGRKTFFKTFADPKNDGSV